MEYGDWIEYYDRDQKRVYGEYRGKDKTGKIFVKNNKGRMVLIDEKQVVKK